jgi:hypothetical protein
MSLSSVADGDRRPLWEFVPCTAIGALSTDGTLHPNQGVELGSHLDDSVHC